MSTIEKIAVYDARIIQESPKYAVQKGALSVSVSPFNAISASSNQQTYQILVPSLNVFVDRKIDLQTGVHVAMEAVPSQYSTKSTSFAVAAGGVKSVTTAIVPVPQAPTSNAQAIVDLNQITGAGSIDVTQIGANSTLTFAAGAAFVLSNCVITANNGATTLVLTFPAVGTATNGLDFRAASASAPNIRSLLIGASIQGTGTAYPNRILTANWTTANTVTVTMTTALSAAATGGDYVISSTVDVSYPLQRFELFSSHNQTGVQVANSQMGRCYITLPWDVATFGSYSAVGAATLATASGFIATPQLVSQVGSIQPAREVVVGTTRGYGVNSGFLLPQGSFSGCTGPSDLNWYQPVGSAADMSLSMFPVQSLCTNMTASINDCSVTTNGDTLKEQILLSQTRNALSQRTTPSKFDVFAYSIDDVRNANGATRVYGDAKDNDIPNGAWQVEFVNPLTGQPLPRFGSYVASGVTVFVINYVPAFIPLGSTLVGKVIDGVTITASPMETALPVMFRFYTSEPLILSPFLWQDSKEMTEVGLYGCTNIALTMNLQTAGPALGFDTTAKTPGTKYFVDRLQNLYPTNAAIVRSTGLHALYSKIALQNPTTNASSNTGPFISPRLLVTFLTPPPDVTLPLVSTVPYMEFPRYFSPVTVSTQNGIVDVASNTITLSSIPDYLAIFVKPNVRGQTQQESYIPIRRIGVTFDNYSNLCSNFAQEDLYACSVAAGLDMDWHQFRGYATAAYPTDLPAASVSGSSILDIRNVGSTTQLSGGPLLLRMGQDIPLSPGLAPGTLGNFSVQLNIQLDNTKGFFNHLPALSATNNATIIIMAVNSGFFETVRGQSAVRKTILNSVDVESASVQAGITSAHLRRLVGANYGTAGSAEVSDAVNAQDAFGKGDGDHEQMREPISFKKQDMKKSYSVA
jgi:hypothetical protein